MEIREKDFKIPELKIHEIKTKKHAGVFKPLGDYDIGVAKLKTGESVEFMWGGQVGNLTEQEVAIIHIIQPEREFIRIGEVWEDGEPRNAYAPVLFESEK